MACESFVALEIWRSLLKDADADATSGLPDLDMFLALGPLNPSQEVIDVSYQGDFCQCAVSSAIRKCALAAAKSAKALMAQHAAVTAGGHRAEHVLQRRSQYWWPWLRHLRRSSDQSL